MPYLLTEIAAKIGAECHLKGGDKTITGLATLEHAGPTQVSFLANPKYRVHLEKTKAAAVIITQADLSFCPVDALVMQDPKIGIAKLAQMYDDTPALPIGVHPTAVIHPSVSIPESAAIGPYVVIDEGVLLGENVAIGATSVIGAFASIGDGSELKPRVTLYHRVRIGRNCLIHSGAVLGSDGFGLANENGRWLKIAQLGSVELGDEVEIGANTTIDRGAIEDTVIASGVKIDNQVQIAHNVKIGQGTAIAAQVGIAGSTEIGRYCLLGGKVGINGHVTIADQVMLTAMSGITGSISAPGTYSSTLSAQPVMKWNKTMARLNRLDHLIAKVKKISEKLGV